MSYSAGSIEATLDLDRTPFQQGMDLAREQGEDFDGKTFSANLDLDATSAEAQLRRFREQLEQLNTNGSGPRIELDTLRAQEQLRTLLEQLERLDRFTANPRVDIDISGATAQLITLIEQLDRLDRFRATPRIDLDGFALASAQIAYLQHQLDQLSRTRANPSVNGINNLGSAAGRASGQTGGLRGRLIALAAALSPGLIPIAGAATAGIVGLSGALVAAGAGAALFGGAMLSNLGPVKDAIKNFNTQGLAAFDKLDEGQKKVAIGAIQLKQQWTQAADAVRPQTYAVATNVLGGLSNALKGLKPVMKVAADAFVDLSAGFERATKGDTFKGFTEFLTRQTGPAIKTFGTVLGDLGATLVHLFEAFEPLIGPVERALTNFTGGLRRASEGLQTNPGFRKFLDYIRETAPVVRNALKSLFDGFTALVAALAPLGPPVLRLIGFFGDLIKTISDSKGFREFVASLGRVVDAVVDFGKKIIRSDEFKRFIDSLGHALAQLGDFIVKFVSNKGNVDAMKRGFSDLAKVLDLLSKVIGFVSDHIDGFSRALRIMSTLLNPIGAGFRIISGGFDAIKRVVGGIPGALVAANVAIGRWVVSAGGAIGRFASSASATLTRWQTTAVNAIGRFATSAVSTLSRWQSNAVSAIGRFASSALNTLSRWQGNATNTIGRFASNAVNTLNRWQGNAVSAVGRFASSALNTLSRWQSNAVGALQRFASAGASAVQSGASRMVSALQSGASRMLSVVASLPGRIRGALGNLAGLLFQAGANIIQGLINGITSRIGAIRSSIGGIAGIIRGALPFSPAKWGPLSGTGSPNIAGAKIASMLAEGLESGQGRLGTASARLMSNVRFGTQIPATAEAGTSPFGAGRPAVRGGDTFNYYGIGWAELARQQQDNQRERDFLIGA